MAQEANAGRTTRQRRLVYELVAQSRAHPTAQRVFEGARRRIPSISLGTVYRNLRLLVYQGLLKESRIGNKPARFEALRQRHYHVWCVECGRLEDLSLPYQSALDRRVERLVRYSLEEHRMEFYGVCPQCRRRRGRTRRKIPSAAQRR